RTVSSERYRGRRICRRSASRAIFTEQIRALRHVRQRLAVDKRLVSARLLRADCSRRRCGAKSSGPRFLVGSIRAGSTQESPSRRVVPLHRAVLLTLHSRNSGQRRNQHGNKSPGFSLREGSQNNIKSVCSTTMKSGAHKRTIRKAIGPTDGKEWSMRWERYVLEEGPDRDLYTVDQTHQELDEADLGIQLATKRTELASD